MTNYYIATRANHTDMASATGQRVGRLNQNMAATLRKAAMALGIKQKTRDGGRLEFYSVDQTGFDQLTDPKNKMFAVLKGATNVRPLAFLDSDQLGQAIDAVNAKYGRRMDYSTHKKYLAELQRTTGALLTKLENDVQPQREAKPQLAANPYKVGDYFTACWQYDAPDSFKDYANTRVARVSKAYVWLEVVAFRDDVGVPNGIWSNTDSIKQQFARAKTYGSTAQQQSHGHFIPLKGNEYWLEWRAIKDYKGGLVRMRWDKVASYRVKHLGPVAEVGYCYSYTPRWD